MRKILEKEISYIGENADKVERISKQAIFYLLYFWVGLLCGCINELSAFSPFAVSYTASVGKKYLISAALGSAAGYIFTQDSLSSLRYTAALICTVVLVRIFDETEKIKKNRLLPSCISFLSLFLSAMAVLFASDVSVKAFLVYLCEATVGFFLSFAFASAKDSVSARDEQGGFTLRDIAVVFIPVLTVLLSLNEITVFSVSLARIIAITAVLFISYVYKEAGASVCSLETGIIFSLDSDVGSFGIVYALSGLVCGMFSHFNRYISSFVFLGAFAVSYALSVGSAEKIYLLLETLIACTVFMCLPEKIFRKITPFFIIRKENTWAASQRQAVFEKLVNVSSAVSDVSKTLNTASKMIEPKKQANELSVYSKVRDTVCSECNLQSFCWNKNFSDCKKAFDLMSETLKDKGAVNLNDLPVYLKSCCVKTAELTDSFNKNYIGFVSLKSADDKTEKIREITTLQFGGISDLLYEMSKEFSDEIKFDSELSEEVEKTLYEGFGIRAQTVVCEFDKNGKLKIEFSFDKPDEKINEYELGRTLEEILSVKLERPSVVCTEKRVNVCICEKTRYRVDASAVKITADNNRFCGDSFESFYDGKGNYTVVLSDGMGTGMRAAVDSSVASSLCAKLLRAGFSPDSALKTVNSALMLKSADESLATLDILTVDLYTGNTVFYKAGAAATLVKKRDAVRSVNRVSMPIGILKQADFVKTQTTLRRGDVVVMASDGAFEYSQREAVQILSAFDTDDISILCERISETAKINRKEKKSDDITVIALKLVTNE